MQMPKRLQQGAKLKGRFSRYFLEQQQPDFFAQVFTEAHCGGRGPCERSSDARSGARPLADCPGQLRAAGPGAGPAAGGTRGARVMRGRGAGGIEVGGLLPG